MASEVLKVEHDSLPNGRLVFSDDEVLNVDVSRQQIVVTQTSQSNNLSAVYVGNERYDFTIRFFIFFQDTLQKLDLIRQIREEFDLLPFILEEPSTRYTVIWPQEPTLREQWIRGRRQAHWDHEVLWQESRIDVCPPVTIPSPTS